MRQAAFYALMKHDFCWKAAPWMTIAVAVLAALRPTGMMEVLFIVIAAVVYGRGNFHAERFVGALPVEGREIFLAQLFSVMFLIGAPAAAAAAIAPGLPYLKIAGACLLMYLAPYSIRTERFAAPKWLRQMVIVLGILLFIAVNISILPLTVTLAMMIPALFFKVWTTVPKSFQLAARNPPGRFVGMKPFTNGQWTLQLVRWPFLRFVVLGWHLILVIPFLFVLGMGAWQWTLFFLFSMSMTFVAWSKFEESAMLLRTLPIPSRTILLTILLPMLAAVAAGYYAGVWPDFPPLRMQIVTITILAGATIVGTLVPATMRWRRVRFVAPLFLAPALTILWRGFRGLPPFPDTNVTGTLLRISRPVPEGVLLVIAAAVLTLLFLALEKVFAESEYAKNPETPARFWRSAE